MSVDWSAPLKGTTVLDLSAGVAAGFTGRLFAQLGASVSHVIEPESRAPREVANAPVELQQRMAQYLHEGKRTVVQDAPPLTVAGLGDLLTSADIVVHDRGAVFAEELLSATESTGLKVVSLAPFGWSGPKKDWSGDGLVLQAAAGISMLVGTAEREPLMLPGFQVQYAAGCFGFITGMSLTLSGDPRERHVLVTELESACTLHQLTYLAYTRLGWVRKRGQFMLPTATYMSCTDGEIVIAAVKPNHWAAMAIVCNRPDLLEVPAYRTFLERRLHAQKLEAELRPWFQERSCDAVFEQLCGVGVPAAAIKSPAAAASDPQFAFRSFTNNGTGQGLPVPFLLNGLRPNRRSD